MMIKSMTGFGEGSSALGRVSILARIKSINARFLDLRVTAPEVLAEIEADITNIVKSAVSRGTVVVTVEIVGQKADLFDIEIDEALLEKYINAMKNAAGNELQLSPRDFVALPDVLTVRAKHDLAKTLAPVVLEAVSNAALELSAMREKEGLSLQKDLSDRLEKISQYVALLERRVDECRVRTFESLKQKIGEIVESQIELSEDRIAQEAAILACKADPSEELTRLKSHIAQFLSALSEEMPVGGKLKFLLQECNREADTLGAKGADLETSNSVIAIKEELERIREQIANVE